MANNIEKFEQFLISTNREGMAELLDFIRKSDFYKAPASTRFHNCHEGGLLEHSINVCECLLKKQNHDTWKEILNQVGRDSLIIMSLLHDLCKTNIYKPEWKNKKVYKENGSKHDEGGRFDWETVVGYTTEDSAPYGHGEKSVMMIEQFIKLNKCERYAIRWHMGFSEPKEYYSTLGSALETYPVILALMEADLEATYLLESKD